MYVVSDYTFTPDTGAGYAELVVAGVYGIERFVSIENATRNDVLYSAVEGHIGSIVVTDDGVQTTVQIFGGEQTSKAGDKIRILIYDPTPTGAGPTSNVAVTNWPTSQNINGAVTVTNEVEIGNDIGNPVPVTGTVDVGNFPATQTVDGTVSVDNFPAIQDVQVTSFPATQEVTQGTSPWVVGGTVGIDSNQIIPITIQYPPGSTGGFGENLTAEITPLGQYDGIYGINGDLEPEFETYSAFGGFGGTNDGMFSATSSDTLYSYGVIRSKRFLRYRPGQSATGRFTAMFTQGIVGTEQRAGLFNQESAFMVGYKDDSFGILHSYGAQAAVAVLTITAGPSGTTTATIELNGVPTVVNLIAGETTSETAARIAAASFPGWNSQQADNIVTFISLDTSPKTGAFTFSHATASGSVTLTRQGVPPTDVWLPQTSWNVDTLNGLGPSSMDLDPTKLNVFQIRYKWLGVGSISFMIEDEMTGKNIEFHRLIWTNQNTQPHIANPSLKIGYVAYNLVGGVGSTVEVKGASMMVGVDGKRDLNHYPRSVSVYKSGLSNDNNDPDDIHHIVSIQNPLTVDGKINTRELVLNTASLSAISSSPIIFKVFLDVELTDVLLATPVIPVYDSVPQTNVVVSSTEGYINGSLYTALTSSALVGGGQTGGQKDVDLNQYNIVIPAGSTVTIGAVSGANITQLSAAITWTVD